MSESLQLYDIEHVCEIIGLSRVQVYRLLKSGQLGHVKVGRLTRVSHSQLRAFVERLEADAATNAPAQVGARTTTRADR